MAIIEIDGKKFEVTNGKMIIEVADAHGIYIPRFCYHKKLSIAANCRMCLVEVANSRKPVPACATPITDGMQVFTKSKEAQHSQQAVMEFLLINHPLDCPICDQGGECELQDLSMGFGFGASEYKSTKRAVKDDNLGTLIATEMTRCIQCTRCVRFGEEIAGMCELGALGRGEKMQISTYVQHSMVSEVSGNIIDLCPVGALTSKPFRFQARAWEMTQHDSIAVHDCLGSNVHLHTRRDTLLRVVPKDNETINETWLSDRDRFSYVGLNNPLRAKQPMIKRNGQWEIVDWDTALTFSVNNIQHILTEYGPEQFAAFASPSSSLEELYLLQKLMRALGVNNLDHRTQQVDFRDQDNQADLPYSSLSYQDLERQKNILILGCNINREVPLAGVRLRKAFTSGAKIFAINPVDYEYNLQLEDKIIVPPQELVMQLAKLVLAMAKDTSQLPEKLQKLLLGLEPDAITSKIAQELQAPDAAIITGALCENSPDAALLRTLINFLEQQGVRLLRLTTGANSAGAWLAGMLPHRGPAGKILDNPGLDIQAAVNAKLKGYLLLALEPGYDFANPYQARQSMLGAEFVVLLSAFQHESMLDYANVILPIAPYAETPGTYLNVDQVWQTVAAAIKPYRDAREVWKILRVLGSLLHGKQFEYATCEDVLNEIKSVATSSHANKYNPYYSEDALPLNTQQLVRVGEWPLYRCDMLVRHAGALQESAGADVACIKVHPLTADEWQLTEVATISQGDLEIVLPLQRDARIAKDVVYVANAMPETIDLGHSFAAISIKS